MVKEKTDVELYREFLLGNKEAFEEIVLRYKDKLIYFIARYVKTIEIAEDLAQDTFVYVLVNKKEYDFKYSLKTYLYTIAKCRAWNYLKREKKIVRLTDEYYDIQDIEEEIFQKETIESLKENIKKLKPEYQSAIYLADLEDLSYKEISKILDKSMPQVKVLIHRARKALQKITRREEIPYEE